MIHIDKGIGSYINYKLLDNITKIFNENDNRKKKIQMVAKQKYLEATIRYNDTDDKTIRILL